jgi:hypothetical protein
MAASMSAQETTTALTDLLNSLHTHLQTQTQLLPTLHSQLGLSASALEDDLKELREELVKGVESQVEKRRREVDEWMTRCDVVEHECIRYSKALGGNIKSTGHSVGELRKETVLPRRFKLVTEHQEKLRRVSVTLLGLMEHLIICAVAVPLETRAVDDNHEPITCACTDARAGILQYRYTRAMCCRRGERP